MSKGLPKKPAEIYKQVGTQEGLSAGAHTQTLDRSAAIALLRHRTEHRVGQKAEIRSGVLRGLRGTIFGRNDAGRVLLSVETACGQVYVQVTENLLEPAP